MTTTPALPTAFDLTWTVVLVTGAGSDTGIGHASARLLGQCGASVVVCATTDRVHARAAELSGEGIPALGSVGDLTDEAAVRDLAALSIETWGRLDILVNNAGMVTVVDGGGSVAEERSAGR